MEGIVKRSFILAALAVSSSIAFAGGAQAQGFAADLMPPYEVTTIITSMGMRPIGRPAWRAGRYIVAAVDRNGREVNVVLDARDGQVIAVRPMAGYGPQQQYGYDPRYAPPPPPGYPRSGPAPYDPRFGPTQPPGATPGAPPPSGGDDEFFDNDQQQGALPRPPGAPRSATAPRDLPTGSVPRRVSSLAPKDAAKDATPMPRPRPALARANDQKAGDPKPNDPQPVPVAAPAPQNAEKPAASAFDRKAGKPQPEAAVKDAPKAPAADTARKDVRVIDTNKPEAKAAPKPDEAIRF
jgi:hypothetical protein